VLLTVLEDGFVNSAAAEAQIQAETLAQNGLDEALGIIKNAVNEGNQSSLVYRERIRATINNINTKLNLASDKNTNGDVIDNYKVHKDRGDYTVSFPRVDVNPVGIDATGHPISGDNTGVIVNPNDDRGTPSQPAALTDPDMPYVHQIIIKSVGETRNVKPKRTITKVMKVYVSTINPVFRYPLSSSNDLALNGAPYIQGDVLVGGELKTNSIANFKTSFQSSFQLQTAKPYLQGFLNVLSNQYVNDGVAPTTFEQSFFSGNDTFEDKTLSNDTPIDIAKIVSDKLADSKWSDSSVGDIESSQAGLGGNNLPNNVANGVKYGANLWVTQTTDANVTGNLIVSNGVFKMDNDTLSLHLNHDSNGINGSLLISSNSTDLVTASLAGTVTLEKGEYVAVNGNTLLENVTLNGNMYINGNLKIIGTLNVEDGTIFVNGDVELKEMNSINQNAARPVIIASTGKYIMSDNVKANIEDDASKHAIRAFFYSKDNLDLYGVGSRLEITGGIHGENVSLNAVKGKFSKDAPPLGVVDMTQNLSSTFYFSTDQVGLDANTSRLKILYDDALFINPPDGIPTTDLVNIYVKEITYLDRYK
jgi:hypothetical protein